MNGRPLSPRKTVQLLVIMTILAWATQTLLHQWAHGQELPDLPAQPTELAAGPDAVAEKADLARRRPVGPAWSEARPEPRDQEKFAPGTTRFFAGATLEMRSEATILGGDVKLRQVCRWSDADKAAFEPVADLVLARIAPNTPFRAITLDEVKQTLHDAGINLGVIRFAGAMNCTVSRGDVPYDEHTALQQWIDAKTTPTTRESAMPTVVAAATPTSPASLGAAPAEAQPARFTPQPAAEQAVKPQADDGKAVHTLHDLLIADLAERLSLSVDAMQVRFNPQDEKVLALSEPQFKFNIDRRRARTLGDVVWEVTVISNGGSKKATLIADARAWQMQMLTVRPLAYKQIIRDEDLIGRRALVDRIGDETPSPRVTLVGQMAARELKAGTIMTPRLVDPVPLVQPGQLVTVLAEQGNVQIKTVARATEPGTFGQSVRVRNEATRDLYQIILTGPQEGRMVGNAARGNIAALEHN